jgi:hypothetical protein
MIGNVINHVTGHVIRSLPAVKPILFPALTHGRS